MSYNSYSDAAEERHYWSKRNRGGKRYPCPTCKEENALTAHEKDKGYQCDRCADAAEGVGGW